MNAENYDNIEYKENFLKAVIFRIGFNNILKISQTLPVAFQDKIRANFPITEEHSGTKIFTAIQGNKKQEQTEFYKEWWFFNKDKTMKVTINPESYVFESFSYKNFEVINKNIKETYEIFSQEYSPIVFNRIGLRYVNELSVKDGNPLNWTEYIDENLTKTTDSFIKEKDKISRAMSQMHLNYDDKMLIFTYGLHNTEFPSKISRKEFALDLDCYTTEFPEEQNINIVEDYLCTFHNLIQKYFEMSIKDKLRNLMGSKK